MRSYQDFRQEKSLDDRSPDLNAAVPAVSLITDTKSSLNTNHKLVIRLPVIDHVDTVQQCVMIVRDLENVSF